MTNHEKVKKITTLAEQWLQQAEYAPSGETCAEEILAIVHA